MTTSNQEIDALMYTSLTNNLTSSDIAAAGLTNRFSATPQAELNALLKNTTIKRACCLYKNKPNGSHTNSFPITVRIPTPKGYVYDVANASKDTWEKFGYIDKTINVPASICDLPEFSEYTNMTNKCNDFMALYCNNIKKFYKTETDGLSAANKLSGVASETEFSKYKPECACFADKPAYIQPGLSPVCYALDCDQTRENVFVSIPDRNGCSTTICNSIVSFDGATVGGNINMNPKVDQKCGGDKTSGATSNNKNLGGSSSTTDASGTVAGTNNSYSNSSSTTDDAKTTPADASIGIYFTGGKYYIGIILIVIILCCCISSIGFAIKKSMSK